MRPRPRPFAVFRRLASHLSDEVAGLGLLYGVMRYGRHVPRVGPAADVAVPDLLSGDPARLFGPTPAAADLSTAEPVPAEAARVPGCGAAFDFAFPTGEPTARRDPAFAANDRVRGRLWRAETPGLGGAGGPRRCVLAVDGIMQASFGNLRALARVLCPAGIDVATVDLPFNHRRTPPGYRPGQLILGGDLPHVLGVLRQAARDTAAAFAGLTGGGVDGAGYPGGVGLAGISFGGWTVLHTAALLGSVWTGDEENAVGPRWVCGVCPAADLLAALTDGGTIVRAARRNLRLGPADLARLEPVAASVRPASFPRPVGRGGDGVNRVLLHAGRYDRFVPNAAIGRLADAWGGALTWHPTGHMGLAADPRCLRKVATPWCDAGLWG